MNRVRGYNYLHAHTCIRYLWTYDLDVYGPVCNAFDAGNSITRASGGGWALEIKTFFLGLVKCHRAVRQMPFGAQKSRKHDVQGRINQRLIGSFMYMSFCVMCYVFCDLCCAFCILYSVVYFVILCFSFTARPFKWPSLP